METVFNGKILPEYGYFIYWQTIRSLVIDEDNGGNAKTKTGALAVFLWKIAYVTQNVAVLTFIYMEYGFCVEASHPWGGGQKNYVGIDL